MEGISMAGQHPKELCILVGILWRHARVDSGPGTCWHSRALIILRSGGVGGWGVGGRYPTSPHCWLCQPLSRCSPKSILFDATAPHSPTYNKEKLKLPGFGGSVLAVSCFDLMIW
nr:hypothetical protein Iba_chr04cCG4310 [Ipomoea batatas]